MFTTVALHLQAIAARLMFGRIHTFSPTIFHQNIRQTKNMHETAEAFKGRELVRSHKTRRWKSARPIKMWPLRPC